MCGNVEERQKELPGGEVLPTMGGSTGGSIRGPQVLSGGHQGALPSPSPSSRAVVQSWPKRNRGGRSAWPEELGEGRGNGVCPHRIPVC